MYEGGKKATDITYEQRDNTDVRFWMKDVFTGKYLANEIFSNAFTSIDNTYHANSINSEFFKMRLIDYNSKKYGVDTVGLFSGATTQAGNLIDIRGYDGVTTGRYLYHPTDQAGKMEGCFGPMSDEGVGNYNSLKSEHNQNGYTGAYYFNQQLELYRKFYIYNGYQFNIHLKGRLEK